MLRRSASNARPRTPAGPTGREGFVFKRRTANISTGIGEINYSHAFAASIAIGMNTGFPDLSAILKVRERQVAISEMYKSHGCCSRADFSENRECGYIAVLNVYNSGSVLTNGELWFSEQSFFGMRGRKGSRPQEAAKPPLRFPSKLECSPVRFTAVDRSEKCMLRAGGILGDPVLCVAAICSHAGRDLWSRCMSFGAKSPALRWGLGDGV